MAKDEGFVAFFESEDGKLSFKRCYLAVAEGKIVYTITDEALTKTKDEITPIDQKVEHFHNVKKHTKKNKEHKD